MNLVMLHELTDRNGASGYEWQSIYHYIIGILPKECECKADGIGNLIVTREGRKTPKNKVMLCAHMDEVAFIVTGYTDEGYLKFAPVGGINPSAVFARRVNLGRCNDSEYEEVHGVIAAKPVHMVKGDEEDKQPQFDDLCVDIGAKDRKDAEKMVEKGRVFYFENDFFLFGNDRLHAKALDDRIGCMIMIEMLMEEPEYDLTCVFTVQEEIGTRGAACAAYNVKPDYAIVLESTTACDIAGVEDENKVCCLGDGAVVSFMDRSTIYDRELYDLAFDIAGKIGVKCQTKTKVAGGNDSGAIHKAVGGIRTTAISVPTRYLHTASCVMDLKDIAATEKLAKAMWEKLCNL